MVVADVVAVVAAAVGAAVVVAVVAAAAVKMEFLPSDCCWNLLFG